MKNQNHLTAYSTHSLAVLRPVASTSHQASKPYDFLKLGGVRAVFKISRSACNLDNRPFSRASRLRSPVSIKRRILFSTSRISRSISFRPGIHRALWHCLFVVVPFSSFLPSFQSYIQLEAQGGHVRHQPSRNHCSI